MADFPTSVFVGFVIGACAAIAIIFMALDPLNELSLRACTKTHNVYQCEMVAIPKTGEK